MAKFSSMWYGKPLDKMELIVLKSFLEHGHTFKLYLYDQSIEVPDGIEKGDANEIIPINKFFGPIPNTFSDMFRYKMLSLEDTCWVDMDVVCLRPDWDFKDYILANEQMNKNVVMSNNAVFKAPPGSEFIKYLSDYTENYDKTKITFGNYPPLLFGAYFLTKTIANFGLQEYVNPPKTFYPVDPQACMLYVQPESKSTVEDLVKDSHAAHIYFTVIKKSQDFDGNFPVGSWLWEMEQKYLK